MKPNNFCSMLSLLLLAFLALGCTQMHLSIIRVEMPDKNGDRVVQALHQEEGEHLQQTLQKIYKDYEKQITADFESVIKFMEEWAKNHRFCRIYPEHYPVIPKPDPNTEVFRGALAIYEEHRPMNPKAPIKIMLIYDPDRLEYGIAIHTSEDSHRHPSDNLQQIHTELQSQLATRFQGRIKAVLY